MGVSDEFSVPHELIPSVGFLEALVQGAVTKALQTKARTSKERMQEVVLQIGGKCENWVDFFELARSAKYQEAAWRQDIRAAGVPVPRPDAHPTARCRCCWSWSRR
jgi:hypothetical protein